ncbi:MAG: hypothetical protein H0W89_04980 [Candidatus Levybacteria bacterium]|nr:hypothetical protein [Candidatus Levybacteria bacterium]
MATIEHEQLQAEEKYREVKKELAALKAAIEKQEQAQVQVASKPEHNDHEATELFIEKKDAKKKKVLEHEKEPQHLDVSPGAHIVVEL